MKNVEKACTDGARFVDAYHRDPHPTENEWKRGAKAVAGMRACSLTASLNQNFMNLGASAMLQNVKDLIIGLHAIQKAVLGSEFTTLNEVDPWQIKKYSIHHPIVNASYATPRGASCRQQNLFNVAPNVPGGDLPNVPPPIPESDISSNSSSLSKSSFF